MDFAFAVRRVLLPTARADAGVTAIIPVANIFARAPAKPPYPFAKFLPIPSEPFLASGLVSSSHRFMIQCFAQDIRVGDVVTDYADDVCYKASVALAEAFQGKTLTLETGDKARIQWVQTNRKQDPTEKSAWMATLYFDAEVSG